MVVLLPARGQFFASSLTASKVADIVEHLSTEMIQVYMPRFEFRSSFELSLALQALGLKDAFISGKANSRGMVLTCELFLGGLYHQNIVSVYENGTYAVAATAEDMVEWDVAIVRLNC